MVGDNCQIAGVYGYNYLSDAEIPHATGTKSNHGHWSSLRPC